MSSRDPRWSLRTLQNHRECPHRNVETRIWGRKRKYRAKICRDCHLLPELEEINQK